MANSILIEVEDVATGAELERRLAALGIATTRLSQSRAVHFGMTLSAGKIVLEITPDEIRELLQASPNMVRAFAETLTEFWNLIHMRVDDQPVANTPSEITRRKAAEEFISQIMR